MVFNNLRLHPLSFIEKQIKEEDLQLTKSLMNCVTEAFLLVGSDGTILYFNNAACCLFGYSYKEFFSMTVEDLNTNFSHKVWSQYWETIKHQGAISFVSLCKSQQGQSFWATFTLTYIECGNSEYSGLAIRKINKLSQKDLGNSEIRFQTLVEETDAIILIVQDSQICYANPIFEFITGYTKEELLIHTDLFQQIQLADNQPIIDDIHCSIPQYQIKQLNYSPKMVKNAG